VVRYVSCANSPRLSLQALSKDAIGMEIQGARLDELCTYGLEAMHGFVGKLGSDGMVREWFVEVDEGRGRRYIAPVEQVVELEEGRDCMRYKMEHVSHHCKIDNN